MKSKTSLLFFSLFVSFSLSEDPKYCGYDEVIEQIGMAHPGFKSSVNYIYELAKQYGYENEMRDIVYEIPIVFHIVYHNDAQNLPDYVIESQMDVLNANFRRQNENADETREEFLPFAADVEIEFILASEDPNGNPTSGITHTYTSETGFPYISIWDILTGNITLDNVKSSATAGVDAWDTKR